MNLRGFIKYWLYRDTTQHGEFRLMMRLAGSACPRVMVDVGANDGFYASNSFPFVARGWQTLLIEPHPKVFVRLQQLHQGKAHVRCINVACSDHEGQLPLWTALDGDAGTQATLCTDDHPHFRRARSGPFIEVPVKRLSDVLEAQEIREVGVLSIDTEGMDLETLLGLDLTRWRPRVIVTEDYAPKNARKAEYLQRHQYRPAGRLAANSFWVVADSRT